MTHVPCLCSLRTGDTCGNCKEGYVYEYLQNIVYNYLFGSVGDAASDSWNFGGFEEFSEEFRETSHGIVDTIVD